MPEQKIDPNQVSLDWSGGKTRHWYVILPEGMVADDLKTPGVWSRVQGLWEKALQKHDKVYAVGFDGSFAVEARVADVAMDAAVLAKMSIIHFPERLTPLFSDENFRVSWCGDGYGVIRKSDGMRMGEVQPSEALAVVHLRRQYPAHA